MELRGLLKRPFELCRVHQIPVRADVRWAAVLLLIVVFVASSLRQLEVSTGGSVLAGAIGAILFVVSIFVHEFAHALIAMRDGLKVAEIVLHPFGGLTRFDSPPVSPKSEFRVAIAGPLASFILAVGFGGAAAASASAGADILTLLLFLLAVVNLLVSTFNMLPGYPFDGGRVLRAFLRKQGRDSDDATLITGRCGQAIAASLFIIGIAYVVVWGEFVTGLWSVAVGYFIFDSATSIINEVNSEERVGVGSVMLLSPPLSPGTSIQHFVDDILPMYRQAAFVVADDGLFVGMLALEDLKSVDRDLWRISFIRDVMRSQDDLFVDRNASLAEARNLMNTNAVGSVAVLDLDGKCLGIIHDSLLRKRI